MVQITDLPVALRTRVMMLFQSQNYCFATRAAGRTPTFYFAQGGLAALQAGMPNGRLRTMHGQGPLIEITTAQKSHWFYQPGANPGARANDYAALGNVQNAVQLNALAANQRTQPQNGDEHLEFKHVPNPALNRWVTGRHASGGLIDLTPIFNTAQITRVISDILEFQSRVRVDGPVVFIAPGPARPPRPLHNTVNGYLANI